MSQLQRPWCAMLHAVLIFAIVAASAITWTPMIRGTAAASYPAVTFADPVRPNLIQNGSFELPTVEAGSSGTFGTIPGWIVIPSYSDLIDETVDIQNHLVGPAFDGHQLLELKGTAALGVVQFFDTVPGTVYEFTFAYAPRPGVVDNVIMVRWDQHTFGSIVVEGTSIDTTVWQTMSFSMVATKTESMISFASNGNPSVYGMLIDAVTVQAAQCETTGDGSWSDASVWSCAGASQIPGPGNYVNLSHQIDTTGQAADFEVLQLQLQQGSRLLRTDDRNLRAQTLHMESDSLLEVAAGTGALATMTVGTGIIAGTLSFVTTIAAKVTVTGNLELTGAAQIRQAAIDVQGQLILRQQAIVDLSKITATARVSLFDDARIGNSQMTLLDGIVVDDNASVYGSGLIVTGEVLVTGSATVTNCSISNPLPQVGLNPGLLLEQAQQANMLNNLIQIYVHLGASFGAPMIEMQGFVEMNLHVVAVPEDDLGLGLATVASTGALAALGTFPNGTVILKSDSPVRLTGLTIDPGLTLQLAPATTVTLTGPVTNHGSIVVPPTSAFTLGTGASMTPGTTGTLMDSSPASVGALQVTSPVAFGGQTLAAASFTDTALDTHHAVWNWGDGSTSQLPVDDAGGTASATHQYALAGTYTVSLVVWDMGGNASVPVSATVTVTPWTMRGFYQPVDMTGIVNTVKAGSTVPMKFEVFDGTTELTDTAIVSMSAKLINCVSGAATDEIEQIVATGGTSLRYNAKAGQFVYNWKTPKQAGTCHAVTATSSDGSSLTAVFKLK